jgi:hypothetical protein
VKDRAGLPVLPLSAQWTLKIYQPPPSTRRGGKLGPHAQRKAHIPMDIAEIMLSPLTQSGRAGNFLRLVLAECANFGMPGSTIATLDDIAAMLGMYNPIPLGQAAHLAGPLINWRTHPSQPSFERIHDIEKLVFKQRALISFGGGRPGQMVGTSEIVCALGNIIQGECPSEYWEVFQWASLDVLSILTGVTPEEALKDPSKKGWKLILDDEVLKPGGRLYQSYQEIATSIRREAIAYMNNSPDHPRAYLRPLAKRFLESNAELRASAAAEGDTRVLSYIEESDRTIRKMFPDLAIAADTANAEQVTASS